MDTLKRTTVFIGSGVVGTPSPPTSLYDENQKSIHGRAIGSTCTSYYQNI